MSELITFKRPDGQSCNGYYINPPDAVAGVVLIQEWWGLNTQIKEIAMRLANEKYRVLVPDLYDGEVTVEAAEAEHLMDSLDFGDAATQNIRGAIQFLKQTSNQAGVMGFCMGGALTVLSAIHVPETDVAVCWYGVPPASAGDTRTISIPFQGHFALNDAFFPIEQVDELESQLKEGGVHYDFYRYQAQHAFANENNDSFDPKAFREAWNRSIEFLSKHL